MAVEYLWLFRALKHEITCCKGHFDTFHAVSFSLGARTILEGLYVKFFEEKKWHRPEEHALDFSSGVGVEQARQRQDE